MGCGRLLLRPPLVELQDLSVRFGNRDILRGLNASLRGRAIGLLGPNGAGKSTLINTLLGFYKSSAGLGAAFSATTFAPTYGKIRGLVGYMPENDAFISKMSAVSLVQMMGELSGLPSDVHWSEPMRLCFMWDWPRRVIGSWAHIHLE